MHFKLFFKLKTNNNEVEHKLIFLAQVFTYTCKINPEEGIKLSSLGGRVRCFNTAELFASAYYAF